MLQINKWMISILQLFESISKVVRINNEKGSCHRKKKFLYCEIKAQPKKRKKKKKENQQGDQ